MNGHSRRVAIDKFIEIGINAMAEITGTKLTSASGQITTATTTTLLTAATGYVLMVKRVEFSVDVTQVIAAGPFKIQIVDDGNTSNDVCKVWNPQTGALYGFNVAPDWLQSGTAKTLKFVTPTGFTDNLDWVVHYQTVLAGDIS